MTNITKIFKHRLLLVTALLIPISLLVTSCDSDSNETTIEGEVGAFHRFQVGDKIGDSTDQYEYLRIISPTELIVEDDEDGTTSPIHYSLENTPSESIITIDLTPGGLTIGTMVAELNARPDLIGLIKASPSNNYGHAIESALDSLYPSAEVGANQETIEGEEVADVVIRVRVTSSVGGVRLYIYSHRVAYDSVTEQVVVVGSEILVQGEVILIE